MVTIVKSSRVTSDTEIYWPKLPLLRGVFQLYCQRIIVKLTVESWPCTAPRLLKIAPDQM
jgi:hypothetical protein